MPQIKRSSGGSSVVESIAGVPEFSTVTLSLVIIGGTLGIALLRRQ